MFKYQLSRALLTEDDAFVFLNADSPGDYITYTGFCEALRQGDYGFCDMLQQRIWNPSCAEEGDGAACDEKVNETEQTIGLSVKNAVLFPSEEKRERGRKITLFQIMHDSLHFSHQ